MPRHSQLLILPSVLDRLLDDAPGEPQRDAVLLFGMEDYKSALARDLEALLNTRVMEPENLAQYPLAARSVIRYGIPDLTSLSLLDPVDQERLRAEVQYAIENFESRLSDVNVTLNIPKQETISFERMLHLRVDATLQVHPRQPPVSFDATLRLSTNVYQVNEHRNRLP
ncbi:MAG: type VI secretion system baseplate subunit TssE [Betaproteobacteria bacterium]|nr:type VI secretion system baseplate subunit TssE [Betaproteobacteria bacterium]